MEQSPKQQQQLSGEDSFAALLGKRAKGLAENLALKHGGEEKAANFLLCKSFAYTLGQSLQHERNDYAGAALIIAEAVPAGQAELLKAKAKEWAQPIPARQL